MPITIQRDAQAVAIHAATDAGRATAAYGIGSPFEAQQSALTAAMERVAQVVEPLKADLKPEAFTKRTREAVGKEVPAPTAALVGAIRAKRQHYLSTVARYSQPPADGALAAEDRADFHNTPPAERWRWIARADRDALAAIVSVGRQRWPDVQDDMWQTMTDRLIKLSWLVETGQQARFTLLPTPDAPARAGPDLEAAETHADAALAALRADLDEADQAERFLSDLISVVAVETELPISDAFALIAGEAA